MIPQEITLICIDYFPPNIDKFSRDLVRDGSPFPERYPKCLSFSDDGLIVTKNTSRHHIPSMYGVQLIDSMNNDNMYSWKFDIKDHKSTMHIMVGIVGINTLSQDPNNYLFKYDYEYCYLGWSASLKIFERDSRLRKDRDYKLHEKYARYVKNVDEIEMILDMKRANLSFKLNGLIIISESDLNNSGILGIGFSNIKKIDGLKYRMRVSFASWLPDRVKLVSFTKSREI